MGLINFAAMPSLRNGHNQRVMEGRRFALMKKKYLLDSEGFEIKNSFYWNSFLTPILWIISKWLTIFPNSLIFPRNGKSLLKNTNFILDIFLSKILFLKNKFRNLIKLPLWSSLFYLLINQYIRKFKLNF